MLSTMAGLLAVAAFFILSSIAVVWANGLKFNPETKRFEQTVVVAVDSDRDYQDVQVYLNGEIVATEAPFQLRGLVPGRYELLLERPNFQPYYRVFSLAAGEAMVIKDYQPIALKPLVTIDPDRIVFSEPAFEAGLRVTADGELLDRTKLVSRFIGNPVLARRFNGGYIYQLGSELRLFLSDGPHDYLLYTLSSNDVAKLNIRAGAWEIVLQEGEAISVVSVTKPSL